MYNGRAAGGYSATNRCPVVNLLLFIAQCLFPRAWLSTLDAGEICLWRGARFLYEGLEPFGGQVVGVHEFARSSAEAMQRFGVLRGCS